MLDHLRRYPPIETLLTSMAFTVGGAVTQKGKPLPPAIQRLSPHWAALLQPEQPVVEEEEED